MKLSDLKVGDVLKCSKIFGSTIFEPTIFVLSRTIDVAHYAFGEKNEGEIIHITIYGYRLFKNLKRRNKSEKFNLNNITPEEILSDCYEVKNTTFEKIDIKDLPLYIDLPKTKWFERALNKEMYGHGRSIYNHMMEILKNGILSTGVKPYGKLQTS